MDEVSSNYKIAVVREVFVIADPTYDALIQKLIKGFYFLHVRSGKDVASHRDEMHFVVAAVDLSKSEQMAALARMFTDIKTPLAHRIIFAIAPEEVTRELMLFAQEIGAKYVAAGLTRNDDLKNYLKRICIEAQQVGSVEIYESELGRCIKTGDRAGARQLIEKLKALPNETEDVLRILALAHMHVSDQKRTETYLKKLLRLNSQNLWAANTLGRLYLKNGRVAQGIELLEKLSHFHQLNSERFLTIGQAYVHAGCAREAETSFKKGDELAQGSDLRFKDGLAKVKLADGDCDGALGIVGARGFSDDVIAFLNMRAIMAIRSDRFEEAMSYYAQAFKGVSENAIVKAKLKFNMGLACVRSDDLEVAKQCFEESIQLGGSKFPRAKGPLNVIKGIIQARHSGASTGKGKTIQLSDVEWETLY